MCETICKHQHTRASIPTQSKQSRTRENTQIPSFCSGRIRISGDMTSSATSTSSLSSAIESPPVGPDEISADDYEAEKLAQRTARKPVLGFIPQKELYCNQLLPYADALDDESQLMLRTIKENLARAVACREMAPGACFWVNRLST